MEIDRARRYATADELGDDIDRMLAFQPIRARPPAWHERLARFARRHRAVLLAALVVALVGSIAASFGMRRVRQRLEAPARFADHVKSARLALMDPGFRVTAFFRLGAGPVGEEPPAVAIDRTALYNALAEYDAAFSLCEPDPALADERAIVDALA